MRMTKLVLLAAAALIGASGVAMAQSDGDDPYLWLEPFASPKVREWVDAHNAQTLAAPGDAPPHPTFPAHAASGCFPMATGAVKAR